MLQGRTARSTTLEAVASALDLEFYIGPVRTGSPARVRLPPEIVEVLHLTPKATVADAVGWIDKDALASKLREGLGILQELTERVAAASVAAPGLAGTKVLMADAMPERSVTILPFVKDVTVAVDTGEVMFDESAEVSIVVATSALASWARPDCLACVRVAGNSMEPTIRNGDLVVLARNRSEPLDGQLFVTRTEEDGLVAKRLRRISGGWHLICDNRAYQSRIMAENDRIIGQVAWCGPNSRVRRDD